MRSELITFTSLGLTLPEIYEQMGYGQAVPDGSLVRETLSVLTEIKHFLKPRFSFFITEGRLDTDRHTLDVDGTDFNVGRIISRQLRGSSAFAFFIATAGVEFGHWQESLKHDNDIVRVFIGDSIGSVIAEKAADRMEEFLQKDIDSRGWRHTNRFSPGYCGWHVSEQQKLFPMFGAQGTCGVRLTESSLMMPIKSVSGVIGLGENVRKLEYSCGLCDYKQCYKRRKTHPVPSQREEENVNECQI